MKIFISAILGGIAIGLGGAAYVSTSYAFMFCIGLIIVCMMDFNLYTGKVSYAKKENILTLILIWIGNVCGAALIGLAMLVTKPDLQKFVQIITENKLSETWWQTIVLGILCNILIYIAVHSYVIYKKLILLIFAVTTFVVCGFEHCIANVFYITYANMWSWKAIVFLLLNTFGNTVGGILMYRVHKYVVKR